MTRAWGVAVAVVAILHAGLSFLGSIGMGMTADQADPMGTDEATTLSLLIAGMAIATFVTAILLLAVGWLRPLVGSFLVSLAISVYVLVRFWGEPDSYPIPVAFAVLPAIALVLVGIATAGRRRSVGTAVA